MPENKKKTIFISCFFNLVVRNILATPFLDILKANKDLLIVLLVPEGKGQFFQKEFGASNVRVEEALFKKPSRINILFHILSWNLLSAPTKKIHKKVQLGKDHNFIKYIATSFIAWLGSSILIRRAFRLLDYWLMPRNDFANFFSRYQPSAVMATDIQDLRVQELSDVALLREARHRGIPTIGMTRSWDSITTKGLLRVLPDVLAVQSETIKKQAIKYHSVNSRDIIVTGMPHYDAYLMGSRMPREQFFKSIKLNPNKKLIFLAVPSDMWVKDKSFNQYLLNIFCDLETQIIARFPIFGDVTIGNFKPPSTMVFDIPKTSARLEDSLLHRSDDEHLADLLYHSDAVVTGPSSIILDAAIFNKPIVLIGFDGEKPRPYYESFRRYYDYEHQQFVIKQGSLPIAYSKEELIHFVNDALKHPERNEGGRKQIAENVCFKLDGKSGERLVEAVLTVRVKK